jgi:hypothetical protein
MLSKTKGASNSTYAKPPPHPTRPLVVFPYTFDNFISFPQAVDNFMLKMSISSSIYGFQLIGNNICNLQSPDAASLAQVENG